MPVSRAITSTNSSSPCRPKRELRRRWHNALTEITDGDGAVIYRKPLRDHSVAYDDSG